MYNEQIDNRVEQPVQSAPNSTAPTEPSLFTQPDVLHFINCRKWARFVSAFAPELRAANLTVPDPDHLNGHDIYWFARFFANPNLPENLRKALMTLETAAHPANEDRVYSILMRRSPQDNFGHLHPLDRALDLWFNAREELAPFEPNPPASTTDSQGLTNHLPAAPGTEAAQLENGESQSGMDNHEQNPAPANPFENQIENQKSQIENHTVSGRSNVPSPTDEHASLHSPAKVDDQFPQNPNNVPIENAPDNLAENQIKNQKSEIANPPEPAPSVVPQIENQKSQIENDPDFDPPYIPYTRPAPAPRESDESAVQRLARLSTFDYDRVRKNEASKLRIRAEVLDSEVHRVRKEIAYEASVQETLSRVPTREPWSEPIADASALLHELAERYSRYLVLPLGAADVMSLFTTHTYVVNAFIQSPRLNLSSDHGGCGKTTAIDVLASLCQRPLQTESMSGAVLYRVVEQIQPTLLLDELDAWLPGNEEFRGLLNAGHKRDAVVFRCEGEGRISTFNAFAPVVLAGIGKLPPTLDDRSIHIPLVKALPGQITAHFDKTQLEVEHMLARRLARWAQDNFETLKNLRPTLPPEAYNRLGDNWRPLFAIAQVVGGDWPARALAAFHHLSTKPQPAPAPEPLLEPAKDLDQLLVADIRQIFLTSGRDKLRSKELVAYLLRMPDRPWLEANKAGKPISEMWLANRLRQLQINPRTFRFNHEIARGYLLSDFPETCTNNSSV